MKTETFTVCSFPLIVNIGILAQKDEQGTVLYYVAVNGEVAGEGKETIKEAIDQVESYAPMRQFVWEKMAHATTHLNATHNRIEKDGLIIDTLTFHG